MDTDESSPKRDRVAMEARRKRAIALLAKGATQSAVARRLGVCRQAVSHWVAAHERGGKQALASKGKPGRKGITDEQALRIHDRLAKGDSRMLKNDEVLYIWDVDWARLRVIEEIGREISITTTHKILTNLGWRYQRLPVHRRPATDWYDKDMYCSWVYVGQPEGA